MLDEVDAHMFRTGEVRRTQLAPRLASPWPLPHPYCGGGRSARSTRRFQVLDLQLQRLHARVVVDAQTVQRTDPVSADRLPV